MKKNKLLILILLMTIAPFNKAHTKPIVKDKSCNEDFSFNINLHSNFIKGTANELVYTSYPDSYPNPIKDRLNSKIIWEIDDLYMTGLGFNFQKKWLAFHGDYWHKAADGNATMDDYDWANWANMESTDWTHWSHHNDTIVTKGSI